MDANPKGPESEGMRVSIIERTNMNGANDPGEHGFTHTHHVPIGQDPVEY